MNPFEHARRVLLMADTMSPNRNVRIAAMLALATDYAAKQQRFEWWRWSTYLAFGITLHRLGWRH